MIKIAKGKRLKTVLLAKVGKAIKDFKMIERG